MQRITGAEGFAGFNIQVAAKLTCQLVAQPEGQGIGFAVTIALCVIQEREVEIINFTCRDTFPGVQNAERQAILSRLVRIHFQGDLADLRGGDGILNYHQQNATQRFSIAMAFVIRGQMVIDQQLQPFPLNHGQNFRNHFIDQILDGEEGWRSLPEIILQHVRQLDLIDHTHQRVGLAGKLMAFGGIQRRRLACQRP